MPQDDVRRFLRHTLATLAYRGGKALRDTPPGAAGVRVCEGGRTPLQILAHVNDLFDWAVSLAQGKQVWRDSTPQSWDAEVVRFFEGVQRFDDVLASDEPLGAPADRLFQGPIADAFTHVGQLSLLRRVAGAPVRAENYFKAEIVVGRVGPDQTKPRVEF
jgi:hypothetical protein